MGWQVSVAEFLRRFGQIWFRFRVRVGSFELDAAAGANTGDQPKSP